MSNLHVYTLPASSLGDGKREGGAEISHSPKLEILGKIDMNKGEGLTTRTKAVPRLPVIFHMAT